MTFIGPKPPSQNEPLKLPPLTPTGNQTQKNRKGFMYDTRRIEQTHCTFN